MLARMQKSMKEKDQGFTLIELLVVIVIIGILAAIAIPIFLNQRKKGVDASLKSDLKSAATTFESWRVDNPTATIVTDTVKGKIDAAVPVPGTKSLVGLTASEGNTITLMPSDVSGAYCLFAFNAGASEATLATAQMAYFSQRGGLQKAVVADTTCDDTP